MVIGTICRIVLLRLRMDYKEYYGMCFVIPQELRLFVKSINESKCELNSFVETVSNIVSL